MTPLNELSRDDPWPGLVPFVERDAAFFHGRDQEVADVIRLLKRDSLTVLCGRSGLGKTSLLRAGLFPRLRVAGFLPVLVRLDFSEGAEPLRTMVLQQLSAECSHAEVEAPDIQHARSLWEYFHHAGAEFWNRNNQLVVPVLVFDQFEEVISMGRAEHVRTRSTAFLTELADLVENRPPDYLKAAMATDPALAADFHFRAQPCKVVLSFREDFLADIEELRREMPSLQADTRFRLLPMSREQAMRAVLSPGSHLVDEKVAARIVSVAAGAQTGARSGGEVEPLLLSMICERFNAKRRERTLPQITESLVEDAGGAILSQFYEDTVAHVDWGAREFLEDNLISESGYRNSLVVEDVLRTAGMSESVLASLVNRRLLRVEERMGVDRVELTHDVLTGVIRASRDRRRERLAEAESRAAAESRRLAHYQRLQLKRLRSAIVIAAILGTAAALAWLLFR